MGLLHGTGFNGRWPGFLVKMTVVALYLAWLMGPILGGSSFLEIAVDETTYIVDKAILGQQNPEVVRVVKWLNLAIWIGSLIWVHHSYRGQRQGQKPLQSMPGRESCISGRLASTRSGRCSSLWELQHPMICGGWPGFWLLGTKGYSRCPSFTDHSLLQIGPNAAPGRQAESATVTS